MAISKHDRHNPFAYRDLYSGLIRLHILHHAVEGPIFGLEMAEELGRHGYRISLGTLYPLLHGMQKRGYLRSAEERNGQSIRKVYRATPLGRRALEAMKIKVSELFGELHEGKKGVGGNRRLIRGDHGVDGRSAISDRRSRAD